MSRKPELNWMFLLVIGGLMFFWWLIISRISVLIGADGAVYLETAENLMKGNGLYYLNNGRMVPYVFWPPFYPFLIYVLMKIFGLKSMVSATWIAGAGLLLSLIFLWRLLKRLEVPAYLIVLYLLAFSGSWLYFLYFEVLSETVYLALFLAMLLALTAWLRGHSPKYLYVTGLLLGLLLLTKYAAMGMALGLLWILWKKSSGFKAFSMNVLRVFLPAFILFAPWYFYTKFFSGTVFFEREWAWHFPGREHAFQWIVTTTNLFVPGLTRILVFPVAVLFIYVVFKFRKVLVEVLREYDYLWMLALSFLFFILVSVTFIDYDIPLDIRILAPFFMLLSILAVVFLSRIFGFKSVKILIALLFVSHIWNFVEKTQEYWNKKNDYVRYSDTAFIRKIQSFHSGKIWCNVSDVLKVYVENDTVLRDYPAKFNRMTLRQNPDYEKQMQAIRDALENGRGMVVYFFGYEQHSFLPNVRDLMFYFSGFPVMKYEEGIVILPKRETKRDEDFQMD